MTHVHITPTSLVVDGVDIAKHVLAGSVVIDLADAPDRRSVVSLQLVADALDVDLPDAVVRPILSSTRGEEPRRERRLCEGTR